MGYRKALMMFQMDLGHLITPDLSVLFNNEYEDALEKDASGEQVVNLIVDWRERLTPMAT